MAQINAQNNLIHLFMALAFAIAVWLGAGALLYWAYNVCAIPLGAPVLSYWQVIGICFLLRFTGKLLLK